MSGIVRIGTAGWAIPKAFAHRLEPTGTHLQRYARGFTCVEVNSSFYRPHRPATYVRWRDSTPAEFRFAVKVPRLITHERRLQQARDPLLEFLDQTSGLAQKRGPILVQLPPSFAYDASVAMTFFDTVRAIYDGPVVFEPRHETWFTASVEALLTQHRVSRVAADPALVAAARSPAGWPEVVYFRLHGSPRTYWSRYDAPYLAHLADTLRGASRTADVWCVFDNTALGAAIENASELQELLASA